MKKVRLNLSGNTIASKFKLEKRLGSGNFGDVYLGEHTVIGRVFALKVVEVSTLTYAASSLEAKLQELSKHAHVVAVRSAEYWRNPKGEDFCLIEMEYVEGGNFQDLIDSGASIAEVIDCMKNVLFALDHAHKLDVIHRDVKPANILLGGSEKLSDFGIALVSATGATASDYIYNGNLAPECQVIPPAFSAVSDVFAAGLTLLRALNLIENWRAALLKIKDRQTKMKSGAFVGELGFHARVPAALKRIVRKACATDPAKRYASAAEFRDALEKLKVQRNWSRDNGGEWSCKFNGAEERLRVVSMPGSFGVECTRNGRRRVSDCRSGLTEAAAQKHLCETMAASTF